MGLGASKTFFLLFLDYAWPCNRKVSVKTQSSENAIHIRLVKSTFVKKSGPSHR